MKSKKFIFVAIILILFLGAVVILRLHSQTIADKKVNIEKPIAVSVARAAYGTMTNQIKVTGTLEGIHEADIISETSGKVVKIDADVDGYLPANGTIAQVENDLQEILLEQAKAQVAAAQANSDKADLDLKRIKNLYSQDAVSESQLENAGLAAKAALAQLRGAQAAQKLAQKNFDDTFLRTPIAGRLAEKFVTIGKMVTPGTKIATVVDDRRMKLKVGVPEEDISLVKPGDKVVVTADAVPNREFNGVVRNVALKADPMTRSFQVEVDLANDADRSLKSGMFGRAIITTSATQNALLVPSGALMESSRSGFGVFVVSGSIATQKPVAIGGRNDSLVEITAGLVSGDTVVTFGQQNLKDGSKVRIGE